MNHDTVHARRASGTTSTNPASIPRAPPLPNPRPLQRARDVASRFLGYQARLPSTHDDRDDDRYVRENGLFKRHAPLGAFQNATVSHKTGLEINTVSINESGTHALIGGKEVFKTIKVQNGECREDFNLRDAIRSRPTEADGKPRRTVPTIDIVDVAWAKGKSCDYVAAATSSGKIILYNLTREGLQTAQLHEHERQVHRVTFNPHQGSLLLSGSQDGTVRLWDIRDSHSAAGVQSRRKFGGQNSPVRDVKWSPTEGVDFACGTDAGEIQRWDMRNLKAPKAKVLAHNLACTAVDWHPDGKHILGASSDKTVRVFDISMHRPKRASWQVKTPYPVMNARWRPSCESSAAQDHGARLCAQVVTTYDRQHAVVHIWDFRRPDLPFREAEMYQTAPTDLIWHTQDLLWTVGLEGVFLQTDVQHMPKVIDQRNLQSLAVSPQAEMTSVAQRRHSRRTPPQASQHSPSLQTKQSGSLGTSPDSNQLSRSWADDSVDSSFLSAVPSKRVARSGSNSRNGNMSQTPTNPRDHAKVLRLDEVLLSRKSVRPHQTACRGYLQSHNSRDKITHFAQTSQLELPVAPESEEFIAEVEKAFEHNRQQAANAGYGNLDFWWKLTGFGAVNHLRRRLAVKNEEASRSQHEPDNRATAPSVHDLAARMAAQHFSSPVQSPSSLRPVSTIVQHLTMPDNGSNVPTPLARPLAGDTAPLSPHQSAVSDLDKDEEGLELPPSLAPPPSSKAPAQLEQILFSPNGGRLTAENLSDLERLHSNEEDVDRSNLVRRWSLRPQALLTLDSGIQDGSALRPYLEKHDSNESFQFLAGSTDSEGASFPATFASNDSRIQMVAERPSRRPTEETEPNGQSSSDGHPQISTAHQSMLFEGSGTLAEGSYHFEELKTSLPHVAIPEPDGDSTVFDTRATQRVIASPIRGQRPSRNAVPPPARFCPEVATVDLEEDQPWTLLSMLQEMLRHYTKEQAYPQACSLFILLLGPLLPRTHPLSDDEIHATIAHYVDYFLTNLDHNPDDVPAMVEQCYEHPLKSGLQPLQVESILSSYHQQLLHMQLLDGAAILRKLTYPAYPAVYEDFLGDNEVHFKCGMCGRATEPGFKGLKCERCTEKRRACEYCWMDTSPFLAEGEVSCLFSACLTCGHSGHAACYREWFVNVAGTGCPTPGCFCPCVVTE